MEKSHQETDASPIPPLSSHLRDWSGKALHTLGPVFLPNTSIVHYCLRYCLPTGFSYQPSGIKEKGLLVSYFLSGPCTKLSLVVHHVPSLSTVNAPSLL